MPNPRDIFLQQLQPKFDSKENRFEPFPAVLTNSLGRTDSGSIWKSENAQLAYFRAYGGGALSWVLCDRLVNPRLGLGVLIQYNQYIRQYEVIRDNPIQRNDDSEPTSELILTNNDLLKGGRFQLWLDPTMFIPLSIYPTGADTVNIVSGDYIYQGERKTFSGTVNQDLSGSRPAAGLHRLVGLYLDSANTLNTVDGATIAVGSDAAEPTWPDGAFRLGVVDIDNATAISIDNIDNRKVIYTEDDNLLSGAWPPPLKIYRWDVSTGLVIIEDSLADAVTNLGAGDMIVLGEGDYALTSTLAISTACAIIGPHWRTTRILGDIDGPVINFSANCNMQNIKVENDPTTGDGTAVTVTNATCRFDRVWFYAQSPDDVADGLRLTSTSATTRAYCRDCQSEAYPDTTGYAVNVSQATGTVEAYLFDGYYIGEFNFIANSLATLYDCVAEDTPTVLNGGGSYYGQYRDFNGVTRYVGDDTPAADQFPKWDGGNSRWVPGYVDELWESDGGAVAWSVDADGDLSSTDNDIFPIGDEVGLYLRLVDAYLTGIIEHWRGGTDDATWTGWAAYTGYVTPNLITRANDRLLVGDNTGTNKAFYYRPYVNAQTILYCRTNVSIQCRAGLMVDDGSDTGDGEGADNFYRIYFDATNSIGSLRQIQSEYRTGGGAVTTTTFLTTSLAFDSLVLYLTYGVGTRWTNWGVSAGIRNENVNTVIDNLLAAAFAWTPARIGVYFENLTSGNTRQGWWDFYTEV